MNPYTFGIRYLGDNSLSTRQLQEGSGLPASVVRRSLEVLCKEGAAVKEKVGTRTFYRRPGYVDLAEQSWKSARDKSSDLAAFKWSTSQLARTSNALELYARLGIFQFDRLEDGIRFASRDPLTAADFEALDVLKEQLTLLKKWLSGYSWTAGPGIANPKVSPRFRHAFELHRLFRHRLAWDRYPAGGLGVDFDEPMEPGLAWVLSDGAQQCLVGLSESSLKIVKDALEVASRVKQGDLSFLRSWAQGPEWGMLPWDDNCSLFLKEAEAALHPFVETCSPVTDSETRGEPLLESDIQAQLKELTAKWPGLPAGVVLLPRGPVFGWLIDEGTSLPVMTTQSHSIQTALRKGLNQVQAYET